eukprot:1940342-Heterocapsa_arctica.AAC.1
MVRDLPRGWLAGLRAGGVKRGEISARQRTDSMILHLQRRNRQLLPVYVFVCPVPLQLQFSMPGDRAVREVVGQVPQRPGPPPAHACKGRVMSAG